MKKSAIQKDHTIYQVTLKEYYSTLFYVNRLIELNPSSQVYRNLHTRSKTQLKSLAPKPEDEAEFEEDDEYVDEDKHKLYEEEPEDEKIDDLGTKERNSSNFEDTIPKPKGYSQLDYSRWDRVQDDSSEEEDDGEREDGDEDDSQPQYRFCVKTVGVKAVK
ncbi:sperm-associated antigen 1-like [Salvia divinorum]|uniref:Sperm-associated antigen 1-like n=1 Tax=Salvia divinorum TaxID=28513 RepID=A0ABD1HUN1_SALDI